jgi:hypothetical protein
LYLLHMWLDDLCAAGRKKEEEQRLCAAAKGSVA